MKRFLLLLLLSVPVFLLAQPAMGLDDCIRLAYKQNPAVRNGVIGIKEAKADYIASVGAFLPQIVVNVETGKRFGRSLDPDTNGYTSESFEEGTVGLDMTLSLFEGFSRINQVRFRKMNKERSEWELKEKQNELAYQVTDAYYKLILERKLLDLALEQSRLSERYLKQIEVFVELGLKSASDLQEVKARREGDIYRYQSRGNSSRIALLHLKQLMNIQPGDTLAILDTITASQLPPYSVSTVETLYAQSIEILPSMRMIDLKQKAAHKEYAIAGGAFSPSVFARFTVGSNYYNTAFSARQLRDNIGKYVGVGISFPLLSGLQRLTNQRKLKLNMYRLKNEEELEKQQLYTDIEQTLLSLHTGYSEHQQALSQLDAETLVLKESERKWEEGLISVFQLMEARNRFIAAKAELVRVRLQIEMMMKLEKYYRQGTFL
jgi:outer membrane protein TolC